MKTTMQNIPTRPGGRPALYTVVLLIISNTFMTFAWYGHLKFTSQPLLLVIFASWGVALFEYAFQVPANRIGSGTFTVTQLKIIQECVTLTVFTVIAFLLFHESLHWRNVISYLLLIGAVYFAFLGDNRDESIKKDRGGSISQ